MKAFKKFIFGACLYTVCILTLFYMFALISKMDNPSIGISKYFTIFLFGAIISASTLVFETKLNTLLKYAINYVALLTTFCVIFLTSDSGTENAVARAFAAIFIFTLFYALFLLLRFLFVSVWESGRSKGKRKK